MLPLLLLRCSPAFPDAIDLSKQMGLGWNLGNSLECCASSDSASETLWGNPPTTNSLLQAVKAAGFTTVRIPCAWSGYLEDNQTFTIRSSWLSRVKQVVDFVIQNGMYAILNDHWDGGWLELNPFYAKADSVSKKERAIWTQIANYFKNYDEHLLFAGMNEVNKGSGDPESEHLAVHQLYIQTFVDAVRATGGNNRNRTLVIQAFCTNIKYAVNYLKMPTDVVAKKLMVEVHFYDPWDFCGEGGNVYLWGKNFLGSEHVSNWGQEDWVDQAFGMMKTAFVSKGIPVVIGEFSVSYRKTLPTAELAKHIQARNYYYNYVAKTAIADGIVPCVWDNGEIGDKGCGLFDRTTNTMYYADTIAALISAGKK